MSYGNISHVITPEQMAAINASIQTLNQSLSFAVNLSGDESKSIFKLGKDSAEIVQDSQVAVNEFPAILPGMFDKDEFVRDITLFRQVMEIKIKVDALAAKLKSTATAVGGEAMQHVLIVYGCVQDNKDRVPGLKPLADKMKARFKGQGGKKKSNGGAA